MKYINVEQSAADGPVPESADLYCTGRRVIPLSLAVCVLYESDRSVFVIHQLFFGEG